jgi:hypothetical protein
MTRHVHSLRFLMASAIAVRTILDTVCVVPPRREYRWTGEGAEERAGEKV